MRAVGDVRLACDASGQPPVTRAGRCKHVPYRSRTAGRRRHTRCLTAVGGGSPQRLLKSCQRVHLDHHPRRA